MPQSKYKFIIYANIFVKKYLHYYIYAIIYDIYAYLLHINLQSYSRMCLHQ